jgi:DNA invertase Pin-like site-specific DNA recombinase
MKAAIYARKSTDEGDTAAENKSVTRQVEHGRAFAQSKGWETDEEHVFVDDNISGAEYVNPLALPG